MIVYNEDYDKQLKDIVETYPTSYGKILKSKGFKGRYEDRSYLIDYIYACTKNLIDTDDFTYSLKTRIYWTLNKIESFEDERTHCQQPECKKPIEKWNIVNLCLGYKKTCCKECERKLAQLHVEERMMQDYGVKNAFQLQLTIDKIHDNIDEINKKKAKTKKKNHTFKVSSQEHLLKVLLETAYPDLRTQYRSEEYPFFCDFYIPSKNLYIEFNGLWTHGCHPFDKDSLEDQKTLEEWKSKDNKFFNNAIQTWTERDVLKRQIAKQNNLNYIELWNIYDAVAYVNQMTNDLAPNILPNVKKLNNMYRVICNKDFRCKNMPKYFPYNYIIKYFQQNVFYAKEKALFQDKDIRDHVIANRCKELNITEDQLNAIDILDGFKKSGIYYSYSQFNTYSFIWFIQNFAAKVCYDPCGGWGHRLLANSYLDMYIYNDLSKHVKQNVDKIVKYYKMSNVKTYCQDARTFMPTEKFDSMFTCPPYFNVEHYECGDFKDIDEYKDFIDKLFLIYETNEDCKTFGIVIREDFLFGHDNYIDKQLISINRTGFLTSAEKKHNEYLYIYRKEDNK